MMNREQDRRRGFNIRPDKQKVLKRERRLSEDRRAPRRRVLKGVRIAFGNDYCAVEGAMKNVSETGALIQLKDGYLVPDSIVIYNELEGYKVPCDVVRRDTNRIGVKFSAEKVPIETTKSQVVNMVNFRQSDLEHAVKHVTHESQIALTHRKRPVFGKLGRG